MRQLTLSSPVQGELTVELEGVGSTKIHNCNGEPFSMIIAAACAVITRQGFVFSRDWEAGFDPSTNKVLVRHRGTK